MSHKTKMFAEYYENAQIKPNMSQDKIEEYDAELRQAPLIIFKKIGRDDYSFKKQLDRIE